MDSLNLKRQRPLSAEELKKQIAAERKAAKAEAAKIEAAKAKIAANKPKAVKKTEDK